MGRISFGDGIRLDVDDRTSAHLQRVIFAKLRRGESFQMSWLDDVSIGEGRMVVWIHPDRSIVTQLSHLVADFSSEWLDVLAASANSPEGLRVLPEHTTTESAART